MMVIKADNVEKKYKLSKYNFYTQNDGGKIALTDEKFGEFKDLLETIPVYKLGNDNDMTDAANGIAEFFATKE